MKIRGHKKFDPSCIEKEIDIGSWSVTFSIPIGEVKRDKSIKDMKELLNMYKQDFDADKIIYESIQKNRKEKLNKLDI